MSSLVSFRAASLALGGTLLLALVVGVVVGGRLARWSTQPVTHVLEVVDPASAAAATPRGSTSPGGFTGFGGPPALHGEVLQSGTVTSSASGRIAIGLDGGGADITFSGTGRMYRIVPATSPIAAGDRVVVRLDGATALAVMRAAVEAPESASR